MHEPDYGEMSDEERQRLDAIFPKQEVKTVGALMESHGAEHKLRLLEREVQEFEDPHLTDEENRLMRSFRKFKAKVKKQGKVFRWQTGPVAGEVVLALDTGLIQDPQDLTAEGGGE